LALLADLASTTEEVSLGRDAVGYTMETYHDNAEEGQPHSEQSREEPEVPAIERMRPKSHDNCPPNRQRSLEISNTVHTRHNDLGAHKQHLVSDMVDVAPI
jgi:hypothetical protein